MSWGYAVTDILDRQYFQSIYFREPGGVLFEVATAQPGFTVDESLAMLGRELKLPPWKERHRTTIERGLPTVTYRRRCWMKPLSWAFSSYVLVYGLAWLLVVGAVIVALWRGMQAQERMARHLERIERALTERRLG